MTPLHYKNGTLHIEGIALPKIAKLAGSPAYVYSASRIAENYKTYDDAFGKTLGRGNYTVCYACKANSNIAVLALLAKLGAGADIVSGGELERARRAKIPGRKMVFSGVGKSAAELESAIKYGLMQINIESEEELKLISKIAARLEKTVPVAIRVNPDVDAKTHAKITTGTKENKFGIDIGLAPALYAKAARMPGIRADGVAVHIGSQLLSLAPYRRAYQRVAKLVGKLRKDGHAITRVDIGGGLGIRYKNETPPDLYLYALMVQEIIAPLNVHIILEPGRSIVGDAGVLLSSVRHVKKGSHKKFLILDAAMNDLLRPALYDAYHAVLPVKKTRATETYDVVGPICETGDTLLVNEKMPKLDAGDHVAIMTAGAYGAVMASNYNPRPLVAEVLVQGDKAALIRRPQKTADILRQEIIPGFAR